MKKTFLSLFASAMVVMAFGQNPTLPKEVEAAFSKKFPSVTEAKWEQEDDEWEVEFKQNGTETTASFDKTGKWLETETEVKKKDVPAEIFKAVILKFEGWEIEEIARIEKPDFKGYEIAMEKGETETEVLVSDTGEMTITKVKAGDEGDEEEHGEKDDDHEGQED